MSLPMSSSRWNTKRYLLRGRGRVRVRARVRIRVRG